MREWLLQRKWDVIGVSFAVILGAVLVYVNFTTVQPKKRQAICQSNLKMIGLGTLQYVRDSDEKYMPANNWQDAISPYLKKPPSFLCPLRGDLASGYAYQKLFSNAKMSLVTDMSKCIIFFDSSLPMRNASDSGASVPSPSRHLLGNNFAFMDGHVKAFVKPDFVSGTAELRAAILERQKRQVEWKKQQDKIDANKKRLSERKAKAKKP